MKLLFFIYSLGSGGAERVTANLANHWAEKGWDVTIVTLAPWSFDFYVLNPRVRRISMDLSGDSSSMMEGLWQNCRRMYGLRSILRSINPDISIAMMTSANVLLSLASLGFPRLATIGSERIFPPCVSLGRLWKGLRKYCYAYLDAVTALTTESAEWIRHNTKAKRVTVIPNVASWPLIAHEPVIDPCTRNARQRRLLLAVGRLDPQKGYDLLLAAFSKLVEKYPDWDLVILGEGQERRVLEAQICNCALGDRVFLYGRIGNVGAWYAHSDLYVMSSRFEGFPNTLLEAMAHGLPAVSFDCDSGPRDIIRHGVDGLLVPCFDVDGLATALEKLIEDSRLRKCFAERAIEVRERFSMKIIAGLWEKLFEDVMHGN